MADSDLQVFLVHGDDEAVVSPYGASLRGYFRRAVDGSLRQIATLYAGAAIPAHPARAQVSRCGGPAVGEKIGGQGDVLIPFPGRIREGQYSLGGRHFQLEKSDQEGPNAIHGFLRNVLWETRALSENAAAFSAVIHPDTYPGYPFSLEASVSYRVDDQGLGCSFTVRNPGSETAPVGVGFHPYFTTGSSLIDSDELWIPMANVLDFENMIPTGHVLPVDGLPVDFQEPRLVGETRLNHCYLNPERDPDGRVRILLRNQQTGRAVTVWMDRALDYLVVYSGDPMPEAHRRRALAIEPMTCGSDAFNHPEWGLTLLKPGETMSGAWGVQVVDRD